MLMSILVLVVSTALFLFYIQTICDQALRREFSRPYFKDIVQAVRLEYPHLRESVTSNGRPDYLQMRRALKCDFFTLDYLLKKGDSFQRGLHRGERLLGLYFRFLLFSLPVRQALHLKEREAVLRLATILQYFANSVGERMNVSPLAAAESVLNS